MNPKRSVLKSIKKYKNFLISSHVGPEGDSLGSQLAMRELLINFRKNAVIINEDAVPLNYQFLAPYMDKARESRGGSFDAAIILDCSSLSRVGKVAGLIDGELPLINIDHHVSNVGFADINWIDTKASSACEMVYDLFIEAGVSIDKRSALFIYAGILTDTGCFRFRNTTSRTHEIVADLLKRIPDPASINSYIYGSYSRDDTKILINTLKTLKFDSASRIAWFKLRRPKGYKMALDLTDRIIDIARNIRGIEVVVLFKETKQKNQIRINLRSRGTFDVNKFARFFGGGGHKTASGCTIVARLDVAEELVIEKLKRQFSRLKSNI